ncbi:helix-turn-helix domain-containing protein [Leifsonia sp. H3M29-4]|uniref:ArsR/SmtB family transcription factor n=1 Tax=Salinibacterium metalliresistens TaxID=3031321 RepID=UPI0023DBE01D|nr:helix-turn-helix domain-containing protein [Salinibacterium metalliresistens]MDF1478733.1 helix-turn-helix domain-containing protein [Salinibacterium metalliresistens]
MEASTAGTSTAQEGAAEASSSEASNPELSSAELSNPEPSSAEPSSVEPSSAEPSNPEPSAAETRSADETTAEATHPAGLVQRTLDMEGLKALAHPLRVRIFDTLSTYGQFTASGLAERLDESSGATSYHLRQLEKHGFVREVPGKGTARERWWERVPGGIALSPDDVERSDAAKAASRVILAEWERTRSRLLNDFLEHGEAELSEDWLRASDISTINLRVTREQFKEITEAWMEFINPFVVRYRGQNPPGSRPVQVQFNAFPVLDGEETPA